MVKFLLALWPLVGYLPLAAKVIDLKPGDIAKVQLSGEGDIKVNRKNVIALEHVFDKTWTIYALKKGIVIITLKRFDQTVEKTMVRVGYQKPTSLGEKWQSYLCEESQITCQRQKISGTMNSWRSFYQSKHKCINSPPCDFAVQLTAQSKLQLENFIKGRRLRLSHFSPDGHLSIEGLCVQKQMSAKLKKIFYDDFSLNCHQSLVNLKVQGLVFWLKTEDLKQIGLKPWRSQRLPIQWDWQLTAFLQKNRSRIIASPQMNLVLNSKAMVRTGVDTTIPLEEGRIATLKNGISLSLAAADKQQDKVKLVVELDVSQSQQGTRKSDRSVIQSELWLTLGSSQLVGSISANAINKNHEDNPILAKIPIISPLFRTKGSQNTEAHLFLSLLVSSSG